MTPVRTAGPASNPRSAPRASQSAKRPSGAVPPAGRSSGGRSAVRGRSMRGRASACARCVPTDRRHDGAGNELGLEHSAPTLGTRIEDRIRTTGKPPSPKGERKLTPDVREKRGSREPKDVPAGSTGRRSPPRTCLQTITRRRRVATGRSCPLEGGCDLD
jgi:hypothetical protein